MLDKIEDIIDNPSTKSYIKEAASVAAEKIKEYYPTTNGHVYIVATSMLKYISTCAVILFTL